MAKNFTAEANAAIDAVAQKAGASKEEIRACIQQAIDTDFFYPDPDVQTFWSQIPAAGKIPTPEELIIWICEKTNRG